MKKVLILGVVVAASVGINAEQLPGGVDARVDYIGGNPSVPYIPSDQRRIEDIPALDSQKQIHWESTVGNVGGSATPATSPDFDTSQPSDE
ncbi:MAG: hypothetical protein WCP46_04385 [Alphaproteobacteria bacterium]